MKRLSKKKLKKIEKKRLKYVKEMEKKRKSLCSCNIHKFNEFEAENKIMLLLLKELLKLNKLTPQQVDLKSEEDILNISYIFFTSANSSAEEIHEELFKFISIDS